MANIGEQIVVARKAKGMTQDALAKALHVSRQAVSHWETGRTLPDAEMLIRLSQMLEYSFEDEAVKTRGDSFQPTPTTGSEAADANPAAKPRRVSRRVIIAWAAAIVAIACVCAVAFFRTHGKKPVVTGAPGEVPPVSWFAETVPNEPGKAYLAIEPKASVVQNDESTYQMYDFQIIERNGIGFDIEYVIYLHYSKRGNVYRGVFTAQDFRSFGLDPSLPPYGTMPFNGGFPQGEFDSTGIIVHGSDANGTPMVFHGYLEFP